MTFLLVVVVLLSSSFFVAVLNTDSSGGGGGGAVSEFHNETLSSVLSGCTINQKEPALADVGSLG